ncbi:hypothetical protein FIU85_16220 [Roseovarius sp. THAF8]|nr:hypothetical protein FIU85_16220 [Roseovarius sp. THAF8]
MRGQFLSLVCVIVVVCLGMSTAEGRADEDFRLGAPPPLIESGLLEYVLPRFSLKTGIRVEVVDLDAGGDILLAPDAEGPRVFDGPQAKWRMQINTPSHEGAARFAEWLTSEIGQRTVTSYEVGGAAPFGLPKENAQEVAEVSFDGDAGLGHDLSVAHCARCHAVSEATRMNAMASTPSFAVLRAMADWDRRFQTFYILNPHPAFTQVKDVTEPFPINRPSPIAPMEITIDDLQAILAYVAGVKPADLGAPIEHQ